MSTDFILPDIGEGIVECEVIEWLVAEGEEIKEDQPVCEVMTDKAMVEIPAISDGVVTKIYYQKGETAIVHEPLFQFKAEGGVIEPSSEASPTQHVAEQVMESTPVTSEPVVNADTAMDFLLPDIGEGIVECEVIKWLVAEGDTVEEDQPVCEVMTDKAMVELPSKHDGVITRIYYAEGETAIVHEPLYAIQVAGQAAAAPVQAQTSNDAASQSSSSSTQAHSDPSSEATGKKRKAVASPAVRRLAREMNIDITQVHGSGEKGRVYKADIHAFKSGSQAQEQSAPAASQVVASVSTEATQEVRIEPIKGVKAAMAKAMQESVSTIPHFTYSDEIDLTDLIALRKKLKPEYEKQGIKLTMMPFFIKAMSLALKEFPILNARVNEECTEIHYQPSHNIGMAVDSKIGLLVPNIKGCETKSIRTIAEDVMAITDSARAGRLSQEQLKGGTISISNIGALGGTTATPIINKPELAIVALGKLQTIPRFDANGNVEARSIMQVSWSGDHRVIDGGTIARFNNLWTKYLQDPSAMMMEMV